MTPSRTLATAQGAHATDFRLGILLVAGSAITWSFGGTIARFLTVEDSWTIVFWRSAFAAGFLLVFMLLRDGWRGTLVTTIQSFQQMDDLDPIDRDDIICLVDECHRTQKGK